MREPFADVGLAGPGFINIRLNDSFLARHTGQSVEQIEKDADRDYYMNADQAKEYGLVDEVVAAVYGRDS